MNKIMLVSIFVFLFLVNSAIAESGSEQNVLDTQNCEDLAELMNAEYPYEDEMKAFASRYARQVISIDGFIYDEGLGSFMRDIEIQAGNYADVDGEGPHFMFKGVDPEDFGGGSEYPEFIRYGKDVRAVGQIEEYDDFDDCIVLKLISIEERNPLLEELEVGTYATLEKGSKGDDVKALQQRLIDLYYLDGSADSIFGNGTKAAVEEFQSAANLKVTGIADSETQTVLFSDKAPEASLTITCSSVVIGSNAKTVWYVDGQEFTLQGNKTKTIKTRWGTYRFDAYGHSEKIED